EPRVCVLATAVGDDPAGVARSTALFAASGAAVSHLALFPMPNVADPADFLLSQDVIWAGGGSVANMLAVWRVHGLDRILRKAWQDGIVLAGVSAGGGRRLVGRTPYSFGPDLRPFRQGLGFFPGSYCPHYDPEPQRRPLFTSLVAAGVLPAGMACEDAAGAHLVDDRLDGMVGGRAGVRAYRVEPDGSGGFPQTPPPRRLLPRLVKARRPARPASRAHGFAGVPRRGGAP